MVFNILTQRRFVEEFRKDMTMTWMTGRYDRSAPGNMPKRQLKNKN